MKLAILFHRLGPYHRARLDAAGRLGEVWCIEGCGMDTVYAWDVVASGSYFHRLTLFPNMDSGQMNPREVSRAVVSTLDRIDPAAVAIPGWQHPLAHGGLQWALRSGRPVILMSDSHELGRPRHGLSEFVKRGVVRLCATGFVSGSAAGDYLVRLGMKRERIFTHCDVVDNSHFSHRDAGGDERDAETPSGHKLPMRHFLCPGRFVWEKNHERMLRAYARYLALATCKASASPRGEPWRLVLLGDGPLRQEIQASVRRLGLEEHVHLAGFAQYPDLPAFYRLASACILASISETWGLVVNEAMASGLPVLVSNRCGCVPDLVREGVNGFSFDPWDVEGLARLMLLLAETPKCQLSEMGAMGREIIRGWSLEMFAANLWRALAAAVVEPRPRGTRWGRMMLDSCVVFRQFVHEWREHGPAFAHNGPSWRLCGEKPWEEKVIRK